MRAVLEVPSRGLSARAGELVWVRGAGAASFWSQAAGADVSSQPLLFKGRDISPWTPQQRRRAGFLALFEEPSAPPGLTVAQLIRLAAGARAPRGLRQSLHEAAQAIGISPALLEFPLDDPRWAGRGAQAEWLQAGCLHPEVVVSAAAVDERSAAVARALAKEGCAVFLTGAAQALAEARCATLP